MTAASSSIRSNPLAWFSALFVLVPAYLKAHRDLARMPVTPDFVTETTPIPVIGPTDGSMVVDAVLTAPVPIVPPRLSRLRRPASRRRR
ncbi:hypothetical protein [Microbacterium neungamense]|uniref:hypothetical protein n=1 Tax=Microbacterium TaxID=33882 RepID=UPI003D813D07